MNYLKKLLLTGALLSAALPVFAGDVAIEITGNDQMQFSSKAFEVSSGDTVTLTFKNVGTLPVMVMGHNLVILKAGNPIAPFATAAMQAKDQGYIPQGLADQILAHTKLLGPGEEEIITFTAPAPGTYNYLCSFPGHFGIMNGIMTVK